MKALVPEKKEAFPKKKKLNKADFTFKSLNDQVLIKKPGDIDGNAFMIKDLKNCTVILLDHSAQITVDRCHDTKFFVGPIKASIFYRDCTNCEITVSCCQFRCRDLKDSTVNLYTPNEPIVESSSNITFAPYNFKYPLLEEHSKLANLQGEYKDDDGKVCKKFNRWNEIHDFTKKADGTLNYKLIDKDDFRIETIESLPDLIDINFKGVESDFIFELP